MFQMLLCIPFYMMRYFDGQHSEVFTTFENLETARTLTSIRRSSITTALESVNRLEWVSPFLCLFTCKFFSRSLVPCFSYQVGNSLFLEVSQKISIQFPSSPFLRMFFSSEAQIFLYWSRELVPLSKFRS